MADRLDLHTHSTASDGLLSPTDLVVQASHVGVTTLGLTDHDTTDGIAAASEAARGCGVELVPGIEITAYGGERELHLLGYFVPADDARLKVFLTDARRQRVFRMFRMLEKLAALGVELEASTVMPDPGRAASVGRPHLARVLVERGHARDMDDAFRRYLGRRAPCYVPREQVRVEDVLDLVRGIGGLPVLAHPGLVHKDELIPELVRQGLAGIEVYHPEHDHEAQARYRRLAGELGILVTGGSDYHGDNSTRHGELGLPSCPPEDYARLREAAARAKG